MRLKRCFAMFATVCLIFSVSLAPCSASAIDLDTRYPESDIVNDEGMPYSGLINPSSGSWVTGLLIPDHTTNMAASSLSYLPDGMVYFTPIAGSKYAYGTSSGGASTTTWNCYPTCAFIPYSGTINTNSSLYVSIGMVSSEGGTDVVNYNQGWNFGYYDKDTNFYSNSTISLGSSREYVVSSSNPVDAGGDTWLSQAGQIGMRIDIQATEATPIRQVDFWSTSAHWSLPHTGGTMTAWGYFIPYCFLMETSPYQSLFDEIFAELVSIDDRLATHLPQIYLALEQIVTNLESLNADTDTIIEVLNFIKLTDMDILDNIIILQQIDSNIYNKVDSIYALLLSDVAGADDLSGSAADATDQIYDVDMQEVVWQSNMSANFERLELEGFSLTMLDSGLELVGNMFSSIWSAFGNWTIVFTFPLIFGIALLVIGRLSKHGGGNSSRNSEHKGGEGGA